MARERKMEEEMRETRMIHIEVGISPDLWNCLGRSSMTKASDMLSTQMARKPLKFSVSSRRGHGERR